MYDLDTSITAAVDKNDNYEVIGRKLNIDNLKTGKT